MKKITTYLLLLMSLALLGCKTPKDAPTTVKNVNIKKYLGKWYEIASFPNRFQRGCRCTSAQYGLIKNNRLSVLNRCIKYQNTHYSDAKGVAWAPNPNNFSKLKVRFFWPFSGDYWILYLDKHYGYVLVGSPNREYLWILARHKTLALKTYKKLVTIAKQKGYDVKKLKKTLQNCSH